MNLLSASTGVAHLFYRKNGFQDHSRMVVMIRKLTPDMDDMYVYGS